MANRLRVQSDTVSFDQEVLVFVLAGHPVHMSVPVLAQEILARSDSADKDVAPEYAVVRLVNAGLLECRKGRVVPTGPALEGRSTKVGH